MTHDEPIGTPNSTVSKRRRGRKPADANDRRAKVSAALADLEESRTPFSMSDLAERAGISRATLYRDAALRDIVGTAGEGPKTRPVNYRDYEKQKAERDLLVVERRTLRRVLREKDARIEALEERIDKLETNIEAFAQRAQKQASQDVDAIRRESYQEGFSQGVRTAMGQRGGAGAGNAGRRPGAMPQMPSAATNLVSIASRLPKAERQTARRNLARVLHPDLFAAEDAATATLATELLKQLNAIAALDAENGDKRTGNR